MKKKAVFNWSGGKDSALALYKTLQDDSFEVVALLTTIDQQTSNSSVHHIPIEFLEAQAESIGIPLYSVFLPEQGLKGYDKAIQKAIEHFKKAGASHFIFGDIFLYDVKAIRERQLNPYGIEVVEPLWDKTSDEIMDEFLLSGIKTKIVVTQADKLGSQFVGQDLDKTFIESLPSDIDICGENGEYHTFVYDGPIFHRRIDFKLDTPQKLSCDIKLEDGNTQAFTYWHTPIMQN